MNDALSKMAVAAKELSRTLADGSLVREVLSDHEEEIMREQHIQLLEGKDSSDNDMRPYYTEDLQPHGHFKSVESASAYMVWKESLTYPYQVTRGNSNAPNLYVNGRFYNEMGIKYESDKMAVVAKTPYADEIMNKYGLDKFGLSKLHWDRLMYEGGIKTSIQERVAKIIYGN